ncbi:MAG: GAF domain-containing protein, partial [Burkholderiaceae bacterium]|nr:GAF domain-containing protein [Burkholderiaceae bacterium]
MARTQPPSSTRAPSARPARATARAPAPSRSTAHSTAPAIAHTTAHTTDNRRGARRPGDLQASTLRLHAARGVEALCKISTQEAPALTRARRVLLILPDAAEGAHVVAHARLPQGESAANLLAAITPWLIEAHRTYSASLRHGPEGADAIEQRSCLVAPLVARRGFLLGFLYCDVEGAFGRFDDADRSRIAMLASHTAVALANLRFAAGLEAQVAARTIDARAAQLQAGQRAAELALVNDIQQGVAAGLDFRAIVDVVGERLRALFASEDIGIAWLDEAASVVHQLYVVERGQRIHIPPFAVGSQDKVVAALRTGQPLLMRNPQETAAYDVRNAPGTAPSRSSVLVPVMVGDRPHGAIRLVSLDREDAFDEATVKLLVTVAAAMGVALHNAHLFDETQRALARQTATSDVLQVISESPTDVQPVFDIIAERATALTHARYCLVTRFDGELLHLASLHGVNTEGTAALRGAWPQRLEGSTSIAARAIRQRSVVNVADLLAESDADYAPAMKRVVETAGFRSGLSVPMLNGEQIVGAITVNRAETGLYADKEVALLQTFARQAVVAIENVRLFNETREALERQTATANVLKAISRTTFDLAAVLEVLIGTAARLCGASLGVIFRVDGDLCLASGLFGATPALIEHLAAHPPRLSLRDGITSEAAATRHPVQVEDAATDARYGRPDVQRVGGYRTLLGVPILRETDVIGVLTLGRAEARAFDAKEIELVTSFADQAAIAMENVRLFNETQEALEQQTASAEVLQVISSSVADTSPVFDKILDSCERLFATDQLAIYLVHDDGQVHVGALRGAAIQTMTAALPRPIDETATGLALRERRAVHIPDAMAMADMPPTVRHAIELVGNYACVFAPMLWEGRGIGSVTVMRQPPRPFTDKEIALLRTFADQAVIAIQNAKLFNETKEALEQQKASAEVLSVISNSVSDSAPVFEAIVQACQRLFASGNSIISLVGEDGLVRHEAIAVNPQYSGMATEEVRRYLDRGFPRPLAQSYQGYPIRKRRVVHYPDMVNGPGVPETMRQMGRDVGNFSMLIAPLLWEGQGIGTIHVTRFPPQPFTEKEFGLLRSFADQAVIAIQNARMFNETQEALAHQTASADILRVISSSPTDVQPVFDAIVGTAVKLIDCDSAVLLRRHGDSFSAASLIRPGEMHEA